jgi:hypothetical protein
MSLTPQPLSIAYRPGYRKITAAMERGEIYILLLPVLLPLSIADKQWLRTRGGRGVRLPFPFPPACCYTGGYRGRVAPHDDVGRRSEYV